MYHITPLYVWLDVPFYIREEQVDVQQQQQQQQQLQLQLQLLYTELISGRNSS